MDDLRSSAERDQATAMENRIAERAAMNSQEEAQQTQQQGQEAEAEAPRPLTAEEVVQRLRAAEKASAAVGAELEQLRSAQRRTDRELLLIGIMLALIAWQAHKAMGRLVELDGVKDAT